MQALRTLSIARMLNKGTKYTNTAINLSESHKLMKQGITITHECDSDTLVLFIHGFTGGSKDTWTNGSCYFPDLLKDKVEANQRCDIGVFEYYTELFESKVLLKNLAALVKPGVIKKEQNSPVDQLKELLKTQLRIHSKYNEVIYIAHSMGGLIAKSMIIDERVNALRPKSKLFLSLAVPHNGAVLANAGSLFSSNIQIKDISSLSELTHELNSGWLKLKSRPTTKYLYAMSDQVVTKNSATPFDHDNEIIGVNADHSTICKPTSHQDDVAALIYPIINDFIRSKKKTTPEEIDKSNEVLRYPNSRTTHIDVDSLSSEKIIKHFTRSADNENDSLEDQLIHCIQNESFDKVFGVFGEPGSGKTIVAMSIESYIDSNSKSSKIIYVDIMAYEKRVAEGLISVDECLDQFKKCLINPLKEGGYFFLLDGVDHLNPISVKLLRSIQNFLKYNTCILFIRSYKGFLEKEVDESIENIPFTKKYQCGLGGLKFDPETQVEIHKLLENNFNVDSEVLINAKEKMSDWFFENRYNLRLLSLLLDTELNDSFEANSAVNFRLFFKNYLKNNNLSADVIDEIERKAEHFSYNTLVNQEILLPQASLDFFVKRISTQSFEMLGYLSARHICNEIIRLGESNKSKVFLKNIQEIDNVYPYLVNKYAKEIINQTPADQKRFLDAIIALYDFSSDRLKAFLCYLLGRISNKGLKNDCISFLILQKTKIDEKGDILEKHSPDKEFLVLHRSVYISLIYLGHQSGYQYIKSTLGNRRLDSINRGFHRQYYGDVEHTLFDRDMISDDSDFGSFPNTYAQINDKLRGITNGTDSEGALNLLAFTLLSLSMSRIQKGTLEETVDKGVLLSLIAHIIENNQEELVVNYAKTVKHYLEKQYPPLTENLISMYKLKTTTRSGWSYCNVDESILRVVELPESVSEHTDFCTRIAQIYLPNKKRVVELIEDKVLEQRYEDYSKSKIISMLICHDLGEYLHGDIVDQNRTALDIEKEEEALKRLSMVTSCYESNILANPHDSIFRPWLAYNKPTKNDINFLIACDIDKLECLSQLLIYKNIQGEDISDFDSFKEGLKNKLRTRIGNEIFDVVLAPLFN